MATLPQQYAQAILQAQKETRHHARTFADNMLQALKRRHHEKLLPRIMTEYEKLALKERRLEAYKKVTPQRERTRVLFELYQRLTATR